MMEWMSLALLCLPVQDSTPPAAAAPKIESRIEFAGKYQVAGQKVRISAMFANAAAPQAAESIEVHSKVGDKPMSSKALGTEVATEAPAGGGQRRTVDWTVPELPAGTAEIFWKCGDQVAGPLTVTVLKEIRDTDWDKADEAMLFRSAALIETDYGQMLCSFFPDKAPGTVRNFLKLSSKGFYNGVTFHRVIKNFMVQGGDPTGIGTGDPGYKIKAEFNDTKHLKGVISMARSKSDVDSAGCQFFITHAESYPSLDGKYTAFGKLMDGTDTLDRISAVAVESNGRGEMSRPKNKVYMRRVSVVEKPLSQ